MEVQSLSVCVPGKACINNCKFCVSRQHTMDYPSIYTPYQYQNRSDANPETVYDPITLVSGAQYSFETYHNKMSFARDNGCNTLMFTGCIEPQQNMEFIKYIAKTVNSQLSKPFRWMEIQTTGRGLDDSKLYALRSYGINTIALSLSSLNSVENDICLGIDDIDHIDIGDTCRRIKEYGFNLRLCLNLTFGFERYRDRMRDLFSDCKELGANQITFRELYASGDTPQAKWVEENACSWPVVYYIQKFLSDKVQTGEARELRVLPNGIKLIGYDGMSVAVDEDCMETKKNEALRYLVLREDGHLYTDWTDEASLLY